MMGSDPKYYFSKKIPVSSGLETIQGFNHRFIAKKELASTNQNQKMSCSASRRNSSSGFL